MMYRPYESSLPDIIREHPVPGWRTPSWHLEFRVDDGMDGSFKIVPGWEAAARAAVLARLPPGTIRDDTTDVRFLSFSVGRTSRGAPRINCTILSDAPPMPEREHGDLVRVVGEALTNHTRAYERGPVVAPGAPSGSDSDPALARALARVFETGDLRALVNEVDIDAGLEVAEPPASRAEVARSAVAVCRVRGLLRRLVEVATVHRPHARNELFAALDRA